MVGLTGFAYLDDVPGAVVAMAHRGGARHPENIGRENTRAAFQHAVDLGYRYLETDVQLSADGVVMAFHDDVLDRVTDLRGPIGQQPCTVLQGPRIAGRHPIPTLRELVEAFPEARFNIDLKSDAVVEPFAALVVSLGLQDRICIGSFSVARLSRIRRLLGPSVPTSAAPSEVGSLLLTGRFWGPPPVVLQVPAMLRGRRLITPRLIARADRLNVPVHAWTIDDGEEMERLLDLGVSGLITDRTDILRAVLERRGQWEDR